EFLLKYSITKDVYIRPIKSDVQETKGWRTGVYQQSDMCRGQDCENEHKIVYLSRTLGVAAATVRWRVNWPGSELTPKDVTIFLPHKTLDSGKVTWYIIIGNNTFLGSEDGYLQLRDLDLGPVRHLDVCARVEGSRVTHARLFNQIETDMNEFPFVINIHFKN
ncbi:unnamed protein product, partial [Meganyctiphanes norvegica]